MASSKEIFFRRDEKAREQVTLPAQLFNRCLMSEFTGSLDSLEAWLKQGEAENRAATILPFRQ